MHAAGCRVLFSFSDPETMMKRTVLAVLTLGMAIAVAAPAAAQVFTPTYQAPRSSSDVGIYLSDGPGDLAVEGVLRRGFGGYDIGLRAGIADTPDDLSVMLGADLRNPLSVGTAPIDLAFTAGIQALLGDLNRLGLQGGLSIGHTFLPGEFSFTPYIHPRAALVDRGGPDDDLDFDLLADLGFDVGMASGLILRVGINLAAPAADWGIGLAWR
jgi:hypothetical protein